MKLPLNREIILTLLSGVSLVVSFFTKSPIPAYVSVLFGSVEAIEEALESIKDRILDVHILMLLAAVGALIVGQVRDAAALLFLFSLAGTLEHFAMARTKSAIEGLVNLRPSTAIRVQESDQEVKVEELRPGDIVRVLPFQQVPIDGIVTSDRVSLDESAMTGESRSVERVTGDKVMGGTQNLESMLLFRVTSTVEDSTLTRIVNLVSEAQENKAGSERVSLWFGQRYTLFVIAAFVVSMVVRLLMGSSPMDALYPSLTLLVALSPCALVISTPASTLSALAYAAKRGILVRGGQFIEIAGQVDTIGLDKTGTLTKGEPVLAEVCVHARLHETAPPTPMDDGIVCWHRGDEPVGVTTTVLRYAAAAEQFSTHPIAQAILREAQTMRLNVPEVASHTAVPGMGIETVVDGVGVKIGQPRFFVDDDLPEEFRDHVTEMQSRGITSVLMRFGDDWAALGMQDAIRDDAKALIANLESVGIKHVAMLTGDNSVTAASVATQLDLKEFQAGLLPADKDRIVGDWVAQGRKIAMVGDGVNDAPALAKAHLGIAMGGLGSDIAMNAADVVLVQDRIERVPELIALGQMANRVIRANLLFAGGVILVLTILSFLWGMIPALRAISPAIPLPLAVVGHEGSTVVVILNGLRLLKGPGVIR